MTSKLRTLFSWSKRSTRVILTIVVILVLAGAGGYFYYSKFYLPSHTTTTSTATLHTTSVRQGNLEISASGTGTLTAADEVNLAFKTGGQVTSIAVKVGDKVKAGDVLATMDDAAAQVAYKQAKRNLLELTSVSAIATAQQNIATAEKSLQDAQSHLSYIISPAVYNAELLVAEKQQAVKDAQAASDANPTSTEAKTKLKTAQDELKNANDKLSRAQYNYTVSYVPANFTVTDCSGFGPSRKCQNNTYTPTDATVLEARAAVTTAQAAVTEAQYLYNTLTGVDVPEDATGSGLTALENAKLALDSAKANLDGYSIVTPISGTVMSIAAQVGDTVGSGTTMITVADLSQPHLEVFLDASDWGNINVGYEADVTFDILPDKTFVGKVTQVDPGLYTSGNNSVVRALVSLDNTGNSLNLPLGTSASVDVIGGRATNAVIVPITALHQYDSGKYAVFVMQNNGKLAVQFVEIGIKDLVNAEVKTGLKPGDLVSTGLTETKQ